MRESKEIEKRVLFVGASLGGGGSERVMSILINGLSHAAYAIKMVRLFDEKIDFELNENVSTEYIGNEIQNPFLKKIRLVFDLKRIIKEFKPNVIVSFLTTCNVISVLASIGYNVKVIISERNDPHNNVKTNFAAKIRNIIYSKADLLVCQTADAIDYFPENIQNKGIVIPNPIPSGLPSCFKGDRKKNVVMVCRLNKQKNLPMAINAFWQFHHIHSEWVLDIYGEGKERQNLEMLIDSLKASSYIKLHGFCTNVIDQILDAGIYLSTSNYEGISNSMLEALALGIPAVVTNCPIGGARLAIEDGVNGILVPVGDVEKCSIALDFLASGKMQLLTNEKIAISIRQKFAEKAIIEEWEKVI